VNNIMRTWAPISLIVATLAGFSACGSTPSSRLFYVWNNPNCPQVAPSGMGLSLPAGFTSRPVAARVAATETAGIHQFWAQKVIALSNELHDPSLSPTLRATLQALLMIDQTEDTAFQLCRRVVVAGTPNKTSATTPTTIP
jgi:hypothetical protein